MGSVIALNEHASEAERRAYRAVWYAGESVRRAGIKGPGTWREVVKLALLFLGSELSDEQHRVEIQGLHEALGDMLKTWDDVDA